jgi:hypothetical protein
MADGGSKVWSAFSVMSALTAAVAAKKVIDLSWTVATGKNPPENPADPDVEIWEAVSWAVVSGMAVGLARMLAQRRATSYYLRSTGHLPGQLQPDGK